VSRSCQRRGIGERLMQEAICWVTTHWPEIKHIELNVFEFNDGAIAFYRRLGFRTISRKMELKLGD
jgi:ribosomal protein S18 acetylase RimI-like enzyme